MPKRVFDFHPGGADSLSVPSLHRVSEGVAYLTDDALHQRCGVRIAFSERTGGVSSGSYASLNLAGHVGDEARSVDVNRARFLSAVGLGASANRVVTAEQVHGDRVVAVSDRDAGRGASVEGGAPPIPSADALATCAVDTPLLMMYADCVPIVIVAEEPRRCVAVVHAGWRGALASIPGKAAREVASSSGSAPEDLTAYIGPHIATCCYSVDANLISQFCNRFDTITATDGRLDLQAAVRESLVAAGVSAERIASAGVCTFDEGDRFFSYRASRVTGRHGALAVITKVD